MTKLLRASIVPMTLLAGALPVRGQQEAPDRPAGEGAGPFNRRVIMGANAIDGTGAPMQGPVHIVIEGNRIRQVRSAGAPGVARERTPPSDADHVIDARGMYDAPRLQQDVACMAEEAKRATATAQTGG